eukprot:CAMPEP_0194510734 /NCGR_PEP_ID=MMETSP0253-20130528/42159_1 /TAXON_ID=2966 /ORGANISM="Noctiluca scintillans" /LENGTH=165 /DNA_ID=CAMNT_0039353997 /DNA_START=223 /DNA_END=719 /DNA_ORIENTATION=-
MSSDTLPLATQKDRLESGGKEWPVAGEATRAAAPAAVQGTRQENGCQTATVSTMSRLTREESTWMPRATDENKHGKTDGVSNKADLVAKREKTTQLQPVLLRFSAAAAAELSELNLGSVAFTVNGFTGRLAKPRESHANPRWQTSHEARLWPESLLTDRHQSPDL